MLHRNKGALTISDSGFLNVTAGVGESEGGLRLEESTSSTRRHWLPYGMKPKIIISRDLVDHRTAEWAGYSEPPAAEGRGTTFDPSES
jgi:hypothetical protein